MYAASAEILAVMAGMARGGGDWREGCAEPRGEEGKSGPQTAAV